jgi:hypothetical protein
VVDKRGVQRGVWCWMGLRGEKKQRRKARSLMDAEKSYWMGLREGKGNRQIDSRQMGQSGCETRAHNLLKVLQMGEKNF